MNKILLLVLLLSGVWAPTWAQQVAHPASAAGFPKHVSVEERQRLEEQYLRQARENIEKYRKGNAELTVTDAAGKVLRNLKVEVNQLTQDFLFGNLSEEVLRSDLKPEEAQKFTDMFKGLYNFTELTVKWSPYEGQQGKPQWQKLQEKLDWCKQNGVTPKGHTLGWTHTAGTPRWLLKLPAEQATDLYRARIQRSDPDVGRGE
ncbi:endo-1,4-beta-xylanase [Telluribacter humicola]|uniref:endo-1,4-beta-xylanase n=1 Tax=Telluribacter humicola TaxID=1720261 RepID=UPI001A969A1C|nr:endo-1,4-beta-xylanase [Telluribacter humicola]